MIEQVSRPDHMEDEPPFGDDGRACPVCHRVDSTTKASYVARVSRGRFLMDDGSYAAYESELSSMLSRPPKPELHPISSIVSAFIVGWLLLAIDLIIVAGLRAQDVVAIPEAALGTATYVGLLWFGLVIPGFAVGRYFMRREAVNRDMPAWREASRRWQTFSYCSRDDIVFVPGEGQGVAPEYISVLYRQPEASSVVALKQGEAQA